MIHAYLRVSTNKQDLGLDVQKARIEQWLGGREYTGFTDEGVSGKIPLEDRPSGAVLLEYLAAAKKPATVVVAKLDRLFRSVANAATVMDQWYREGIVLVSIAEGFDLSTPHGRAMAQMVSVFAELERAMISERTKAALQVKRDAGERLGAPCFGEKEGEQDTIEEIVACRLAGMTQHQICRRLNKIGMFCRGGGPWSQGLLSRVLKRLDNRFKKDYLKSPGEVAQGAMGQSDANSLVNGDAVGRLTDQP